MSKKTKKTKKRSIADIQFTSYCPSCGSVLGDADIGGGRCTNCGTSLASIRPEDLPTFLVSLRGRGHVQVRAESVCQVRGALLADGFDQDDILHVAKVATVVEAEVKALHPAYLRMTEGRSLAVTCLIYCRHNILMGWHIERGGWEFPGGAQQKNEFVRDAVVREVAEETGLVLQSEKLVFEGWDESAADWFNLAFSYNLNALSRVAVQAEGKHREWQWFPMELLPEPLNSLANGLFLQPWFPGKGIEVSWR